jgi:aryl-alcohol dehydrogenase-like predicted oxidoreductase
VFDTAAHYRYGRSARALGEGLRRAFAEGVAREQVFVVAKGGFLAFSGGIPDDAEAWFDANVAAAGLGTRQDRAGNHLISARHVVAQLDMLRAALGLATIDTFLLDQPEVHFPVVGKELANRKIRGVFEALEGAMAAGKLRSYGIATFDGLRVETDALAFQSIASLQGLSEQAAHAAHGRSDVAPGFRVVEFPFNQLMPEAFTRFSQATGHGNVASSIQAAHQLRVYAIASHTLGKGLLASQCADGVAEALADLANDAQRAMQFNRSTPGIGTSLVGISDPTHLDDLVAVARRAPLAREPYLKLYERT